MTITKNLKRSTVMACLTAFCALGVAGQAEARHHHKESRGRQAAGIIHAVADTIRAVTGQGYVVPAPAVVAPAVVTTPVVAPAVVAPSWRSPGVVDVSTRPGVVHKIDTGIRPAVVAPSLRNPGGVDYSPRPGVVYRGH